MSRISKYTTEQIQKVIKETIKQAIKEGIKEPINLHIDKEGFRKIIETCIPIDGTASLKKECETLRAENDILRLGKKKLCESLDYSSRLGMERLTQLVKLKEENARLLEQLDRAKQEAGAGEIHKLNVRIEELEQKRDKIKADYEHVRRRLNVCEEYKDKYKEATDSLRKQVSHLKTDNFGLNQDNSCLKAENEKFRKECADLVLSKREEIEEREELEDKIKEIRNYLSACGVLDGYLCELCDE